MSMFLYVFLSLGHVQGQHPDDKKCGRDGVFTGNPALGSYISMDINIDRRLRCLQQELKRISNTSKPFMKSCVLHSTPQQYPTRTLRLEVEAEIDRLLREQVRGDRKNVRSVGFQLLQVTKMFISLKRIKGLQQCMLIDPYLMQCMLIAVHQVKQRERKILYLIEDDDYSSDKEDERYGFDNKHDTRRTRRMKPRGDHADVNVFAIRKAMLMDANTSPVQKEYARKVSRLGPGGCPACMSIPCNYRPIVDVEVSLELSQSNLAQSTQDTNSMSWINYRRCQRPSMIASDGSHAIDSTNGSEFFFAVFSRERGNPQSTPPIHTRKEKK